MPFSCIIVLICSCERASRTNERRNAGTIEHAQNADGDGLVMIVVNWTGGHARARMCILCFSACHNRTGQHPARSPWLNPVLSVGNGKRRPRGADVFLSGTPSLYRLSRSWRVLYMRPVENAPRSGSVFKLCMAAVPMVLHACTSRLCGLHTRAQPVGLEW